MSDLPETIKNLSKTTSAKKSRSKISASKKNSITITVSVIIIILLIAGSLILIRGGIAAGASALANSYIASYNAEKDSSYQKLYQSAFTKAEESYHTSNTVIISLGNIEETQKLEVLTANDIEFITEDKDNNTGNVTAWLEVEGQGIFVIDLNAAEYVIDNAHRYVLVRVPNPELTNISIIRTTRRLFSDDWKNGSYSEGVDLAIKQRNEASLQIQKALLSNQYIFSNAKDISVSMIQNLVKQFNPDIPDLEVEVEFIN